MKNFEEIRNTVGEFYNENPNGVVIIWWATATGKTGTSVKLSEFFDFEVLSSDSRQIFRDMTIGTDKISEEIRQKLPHHMIDIVNPDEKYTAGQWQRDAKKIIEGLHSRNKHAMVVWGTWLYVDTLYKNYAMPEVPPNYPRREELFAMEEKDAGILRKMLNDVDPESAKVNHPHSTRYIVRALEIYETTGKPKSVICKEKPVDYPLLMLGLWRDKESTHKLIDQRIDEMIAGWLKEEVKDLLEKGYSPDLQSMQGIWYRQTVKYLEWTTSRDEWIAELRNATYHLAKKQRSWFRRYMKDEKEKPKDGVVYKVFEL